MGDDEGEEALVTVSERLLYHKKRGKQLYDQADLLLESGTGGKTAIAAFLKYDDCASFFYRASISFRASGRYRESGDSLVRCAKMHQKLKLFLEAATLFTEAAEIFLQVDKGECVRSFRSAISIYCDAGKFDIAAKMERKVAMMHYVSKHWEDACFHFKKAANFLANEQQLDQADACLEFASICYEEMGELHKAQKVLETLAFNSTEQNLRRFNAKWHLFNAVLMMFYEPLHYKHTDVTEVILKAGVIQKDIVTVDMVVARDSAEKYQAILNMSREYEQMDYMFRVSKECLFIDNIIKCRMDFDIHGCVDHLYYWNNVRPLERFQLKYLKVVVQEIETELARRLELRRLEQMRKDQGDARRKRRAELKEQMKELGLDPSVAADAMEKMWIADDEAVEDSKAPGVRIWEAHFVSSKKEAKRRARAEHSEHMGDMQSDEEPEEGEEGEGGEEGEEGEEEGEGSPSKNREDAEFEEEASESSEDEQKPKKVKKERKTRPRDTSKDIL